MKFISNFCFCLIWFVSILAVTIVFENNVNNVNILTWIVVIGLAFITALIINPYDGKHDD